MPFVNKVNIDRSVEEICSSSYRHNNDTFSSAFGKHMEYINMFLQMCTQRNVAREIWRFFLVLYGLLSVFLVSKSVCICI